MPLKYGSPTSFLIQAADYDPHEAVYYFDIKEVTLQGLLHQDMIDFQSSIPSNLFQDLHYRCFLKKAFLIAKGFFVTEELYQFVRSSKNFLTPLKNLLL